MNDTGYPDESFDGGVDEAAEHELDRGQFLRRGAAFAVFFSSTPGMIARETALKRAARAPLKVGWWGSLTGPFALNGIQQRDGFRFFIGDRKGHVAGRRLQVIYEDDGSSPATALQKVQKLVEQDKVDILIGGINASAGPPVFQYVNEVGVPWLTGQIATDGLTQRDAKNNPFFIRVGSSSSQGTHVLADWVRKHHPSWKRIAAIGNDFIFGYEVVGGFQDVFQQKGGEVVQKIWVPIGTPDVSPFLSRLDQSVDAVFALFFAQGGIGFLQQYRQFGLKDRLPLLAGYPLIDEVVFGSSGLVDQDLLGVISAGRYSAVSPLPQTRSWVQRFIRDAGQIPASGQADGYICGLALEAAAKRRHGNLANKAKLAAAFRGLRLNTPRGPLRFDASLNPIEYEYVRIVQKTPKNTKVKGYNLRWQNTVVATYKNVGQYWPRKASTYLARPPYSRDYPPTS
jgi:branched-chain amino acid transport system substrate-binding protein